MTLFDPGQPLSSPARVKVLWPIALGLALFLMGLWALHHLLAHIDVRQVIAQIKTTPWPTLATALGATAIGYMALVGYDFWALKYLGKSLPLRTVALGGFLGYAFGNTVGISVISGGAVRYRIYSAAGLNAFDVAALSSYIAVAMGMGLTLVGLMALAVHPAALAGLINAPDIWIRLGAGGAAAVILIGAGWLSFSGRALRIRGYEIAMPAPRILAGQLVVALFDSTMAAIALWVLMPAGTPPFASFLAIYAAATMVGVLSHVPGGVGVFETVVIAALPADVPLGDAAAALLAFRLIYFLLPFAVAFVVVSLNEARLAGGWAARLFGEISEPMRPVIGGIEGVVPRIAGVAVLGLGFWLIIVALMPALSLRSQEPGLVGAILAEGGTLACALAGVLLIVLSNALVRRVRLAHGLAVTALIVGVFAVLADDHDIDSAVVLALAALALLPFRRAFHRKAALTDGGVGPLWIALIAGMLATAAVFFFLAHEATPYTNALWLDFTARSATPRALRAGLLASALLLGIFLWLALRPARRFEISSDPEQDATVAAILAAQDVPQGWFALTGDKQVVFSPERDAFLMYARRHGICAVLGDPVGPPDAARSLVWDFHERARSEGLTPVFYEVSTQNLPLWIEMGYALHKIGEEAVIDLTAFSLGGSKFKTMRAEQNRALREGYTLEIVGPPHAPELLDTLRAISESWLAGQKGREKGFSIGRFEPGYLNQCEIALIRREGEILGFANLLGRPDGLHFGIDLMRYRPDAADGVMQFLFLSLIEALRERSATELSLGLAPLAGLPERASARLTSRLGNMIYRHGGSFYNFEGLRRFKQKFRPDWRPRYVALPPGTSPYLALTEIALLISGGARNLLTKD
ncbi:hypothetical protein DL1_17525 [Thioclava dalianensis]|uniref:Phosphatidylglycerol lysyltransferase n=1 Tax=Thioclava dalianensis TaxID=1185766 RepID=A0A074TF38_9RHOB|nr:bifunctional lysylphosphatidylglycerol flippase/synthetase MprF [Thioclava dalianensis]KEP70356.1 hypothetical protein DL1_17525 [Thioclava dalianensis]SFN32734.1 phosphatidylglycerol lysyltransferase [Thioclava dalianensis]